MGLSGVLIHDDAASDASDALDERMQKAAKSNRSNRSNRSAKSSASTLVKGNEDSDVIKEAADIGRENVHKNMVADWKSTAFSLQQEGDIFMGMCDRITKLGRDASRGGEVITHAEAQQEGYRAIRTVLLAVDPFCPASLFFDPDGSLIPAERMCAHVSQTATTLSKVLPRTVWVTYFQELLGAVASLAQFNVFGKVFDLAKRLDFVKTYVKPILEKYKSFYTAILGMKESRVQQIVAGCLIMVIIAVTETMVLKHGFRDFLTHIDSYVDSLRKQEKKRMRRVKGVAHHTLCAPHYKAQPLLSDPIRTANFHKRKGKLVVTYANASEPTVELSTHDSPPSDADVHDWSRPLNRPGKEIRKLGRDAWLRIGDGAYVRNWRRDVHMTDAKRRQFMDKDRMYAIHFLDTNGEVRGTVDEVCVALEAWPKKFLHSAHDAFKNMTKQLKQ